MLYPLSHEGARARGTCLRVRPGQQVVTPVAPALPLTGGHTTSTRITVANPAATRTDRGRPTRTWIAFC